MPRNPKGPIVLSKKLDRLKEASSRILLFALYLFGTAAGCAAYIASDAVRETADRALLGHFIAEAPGPNVFLMLCLGSLICCTALFGSGLCLVGYPCICALAFVFGSGTGLFFIAMISSAESLPVLKSSLLLPAASAVICCLLMLCEYAAEMNGMLRNRTVGREAAQEKKYVLRFSILGVVVLLLDLLQTLVIVLLRHIN